MMAGPESGQPLGTLLRESLDSAMDYGPKLRNGLEAVARMLDEGDVARALPYLSQALQGINWLMAVYDDCREFLAAPVRPQEEAAVRSGLLNALKRLVSRVEAASFVEAAWMIREELLPCLRTLSARVEALSKLPVGPQ